MTRHIHLSGHPDTTNAEMKMALNSFRSRRADVVTLTAVKGQRSAIEDWARAADWNLGMPECDGCDSAILSPNPQTVTKQWRLTELVLETNRDAPIRLSGSKVREHGWFAAWHAPAHTGGLEPGLHATRVYKDALQGLREARSQMRGDVVIAADWNLDLSLEKWRDYLTQPYRSFQFGYRNGQEPTFSGEDGRVIDGAMGNRKVWQASKTLPRFQGFDHGAVLTVWGGRL